MKREAAIFLGVFGVAFAGFGIFLFQRRSDTHHANARRPAPSASAPEDRARPHPLITRDAVERIPTPQQAVPDPASDAEIAKLVVEQNEDWLFLRDRNGAIVREPNGGRKLSPKGERYAYYVTLAVNRGVKGAIAQHDWAVSMLAAEQEQNSLPNKKVQASPVRTKRWSGAIVGRVDNRLLPDLRGLKVAAFADSISCSRLSRSVLRASGVVESAIESADVVVVVVRSTLNSPLNAGYSSLAALKRDSESQLNISGPNGHIYVFSLEDDLGVRELFHSKFEWKE